MNVSLYSLKELSFKYLKTRHVILLIFDDFKYICCPLLIGCLDLDNLYINTCVEYPIADGNYNHQIVQLTLRRFC